MRRSANPENSNIPTYPLRCTVVTEDATRFTAWAKLFELPRVFCMSLDIRSPLLSFGINYVQFGHEEHFHYVVRLYCELHICDRGNMKFFMASFAKSVVTWGHIEACLFIFTQPSFACLSLVLKHVERLKYII
jgi:hypothetical protein